MNATVEKTLQLPNAVLIVRELEAALRVEQKKRQHFYETIDENKKMEFINGEIYFQSPAKLRHTQAVGSISQLLGAYVDANQLGIVGIEKLLVSLSRNDYEPEVCFFRNDKSKDFSPKQMQFPAPDLVVEVLSESTERHDRETKFQDYAAHGVSEYWIIDPQHETAEQFTHQNGEYELILKSRDGHIESTAVEGFSLPIRAIFDKREMMNCLKEILKSAEID